MFLDFWISTKSAWVSCCRVQKVEYLHLHLPFTHNHTIIITTTTRFFTRQEKHLASCYITLSSRPICHPFYFWAVFIHLHFYMHVGWLGRKNERILLRFYFSCPYLHMYKHGYSLPGSFRDSLIKLPKLGTRRRSSMEK